MIRSAGAYFDFRKRSCVATRWQRTSRSPLLSGLARADCAECQAGKPDLRHLLDRDFADGFSTARFPVYDRSRHDGHRRIGRGLCVPADAGGDRLVPRDVALGVAIAALAAAAALNFKSSAENGLVAFLVTSARLVGATLGVIVVTRYSDTAAVDDGLAVMAAALGCGFLGAVVAGIIGHLVALSLPIQPLPPPDPTEVKRDALQAEIEYLERLLRQPDLETDEEVRTKLTAYKARLRLELENRAGDLFDPDGGITVDLPSPAESGDNSQ